MIVHQDCISKIILILKYLQLLAELTVRVKQFLKKSQASKLNELG
jgi:hypothetical protein